MYSITGRTGTLTAKMLTGGAAADLACGQHNTSTPEGLKQCSKDKQNKCMLVVSAFLDKVGHSMVYKQPIDRKSIF